MKNIFLLIFFLLLTSGCSIFSTENPADFFENGTETNVYFCPEEHCSEIMQQVVNNAKRSVYCAFFDLDLKNLISAIGKKSHDADVKLVLDDNNYDGQIKGEGVKVIKSEQYMHNKFCVIDDSIVLTGSTNPTDNCANKNNNNLLIIKSAYLADNYKDEFEELWNGVYASGDNVRYNKIKTDKGFIENYFCPEDCGTNMGSGVYRVLELIKNANKSVQVAIFSFTHEELADELVKADIRGVNVSVLVENRQRNIQNSQYERLRDFGVDIKVDGNKYTMHHKFIVIDDRIVITGSPNFSWSGFNRNDENMLIIYDKSLALEYKNEFNRIFGDGKVV
jgi:phosphatidylserine/phosphatidylglycerophosphate/cardiolipin synthase-like enzyme